jgi:hypothetical protein
MLGYWKTVEWILKHTRILEVWAEFRSRWAPVMGSYEYGNEPYVPIVNITGSAVLHATDLSIKL